MGLFKHSHISLPLPMGPAPPVARHAPDDIPPQEKNRVFQKEKAVKAEEPEETETQLNTRLNALLFDNGKESPDLYKSENSLLNLLGRLYYDDYDSDSSSTSTGASTHLALPHLRPGSSNVSLLPGPSDARKRPAAQRTSSFEKGVSFDTLSDTHHQSVTFKLKHPHFKFRRNNKTFLIGFNNDIESLRAVQWVFQELVVNGDTVIVLQVLDEKMYTSVDQKLGKQVLDKLEKSNTHNKKISLVYEAVIGKPQKLLAQAVDEYKPAMMVVGTHDYEKAHVPDLMSSSSVDLVSQTHPMHSHSKHHRGFLSKSSVSKYFLQFALVPCIVVKPIVCKSEMLQKPVDSEDYFKDWIASTEITMTKTKKKNRGLLSLALSPLLSRNSSLVELAGQDDSERPSRRKHPSHFYFDSREGSPVRSPSRELRRKIFGI